MPRKKFTRKKKYGRRNMRRYLRKKQKVGMALFKLSTVHTLTSSIVGVFDDRVNITNPADTDFSGGTAQDWANLVTLYDSYRVHAVKISFIPQLPNDASTVTGYKPFYAAIDYDSFGVITTVNEIIQYENMKVKNMFRPWKLYYRIPKIANYGSSSSVVSFGYMDLANPQNSGAIKFYGTGFDTSQQYGQLVITYYVSCKNRR